MHSTTYYYIRTLLRLTLDSDHFLSTILHLPNLSYLNLLCLPAYLPTYLHYLLDLLDPTLFYPTVHLLGSTLHLACDPKLDGLFSF